MQLKSNFLVLACLVVAGLSATVTTVTNDIAAIASQVASLDTAINSFTNGDQISTALGINTDSGNLVKAIQQTTTDVEAVPTPVSEADANTILTAVQNIVPAILKSLTDISGKVATFKAVPIVNAPSLVLSDLKNLQTATDNLSTALIAAAPADLVTEANMIKGNIDAGFASAIKAFS